MTHISGTQGHRSEQLGNDKEELNQPNLFGKTLKYPSDLENPNAHYMIFNVHTRADRHKANDAVDLNISTDSLQTFNNTFLSLFFIMYTAYHIEQVLSRK